MDNSRNPFGVREDRPLEVVVHKGGYGDGYVIAAEEAYRERFPDAAITHSGIKKVGGALEHRFAAGNPPDVFSSAGKYSLDFGRLTAEKKLLDLAPLLDAPSLDAPGRTVRELLLPGTVETGTYEGTCFTLNYACNVYGLVYSESLFRRHGWEVPRTWDRMHELCGEIAAAGIAPWTYGGDYLLPLVRVLLMTAVRAGGRRILTDIDNLAPGAWRAEPVLAAAEAVRELAVRQWVLPGTERMSYLEAQTAFVEGKAAFLPSGSWLESEMRDQLPEDFAMALAPSPVLSAGGVLPYESVMAGASEPFAVPAEAANPDGGFELLRVLASRSGARRFTEATGAPCSVAGGGAGSSLLTSVRRALDAAGENTLFLMLYLWYRDLNYAIGDVTARLMTAELTADEWSAECQRLADAVAGDAAVVKYRR